MLKCKWNFDNIYVNTKNYVKNNQQKNDLLDDSTLLKRWSWFITAVWKVIKVNVNVVCWLSDCCLTWDLPLCSLGQLSVELQAK